MSNDKDFKPNWRVGIAPAVACGVFIYIMEQILYRQGAEEGVDVAVVMYDFGKKVISQIGDQEYY